MHDWWVSCLNFGVSRNCGDGVVTELGRLIGFSAAHKGVPTFVTRRGTLGPRTITKLPHRVLSRDSTSQCKIQAEAMQSWAVMGIYKGSCRANA